MLSENYIKIESIYQHISSFLANGEIIGLITKDDKEKLHLNNKNSFIKDPGATIEDQSKNAIYKRLVTRVRDNLHIILSISSNTSHFAQKYRKFPAIFNNCNIVWFLPWSEDTLANVAHKVFSSFNIDCPPATIDKLAGHAASVHIGVQHECGRYRTLFKKGCI